MSIQRADAAVADIDFAAEQIAVECGHNAANLFLTRVEATIRKIATMPLAFPLVEPALANYPGLRVVPVTRFTARLVFCVPTDTGILVVRVLRAASDWAATLA